LTSGSVGYKAKLENGITVVIKEEPGLPIISIVSIFPGGIRYEDEDNNGINKLVSYMLTHGTADLTAKALTDKVDSISGSISGFSGRNSFGVTAQFLKEYEDKGWEVLADVILNPTFDSDELEKLREKALATKDAERDDLILSVVRLFRKTLYKNHPYSMPKTGTKENIKRLTRADLKSYYKAHVVPSEMIVSVVGDVKAEDVLERVEKLFGSFEAPPALPLEIERPKSPNLPKKVVERVKNKEQAHICIGFLGTEIKNDDLYPMEVLTAVLSGHGGRLFVELREKRGLAYSVFAVNLGAPDPGFFVVYMATKPGSLTEAVSGIEEELIKVRDGGVTKKELERAKNYIVGNYELSLQKNMAMAMIMATDELYGLGYDFFSEYSNKILAVTEEDVRRVAKKYIDFDGRVTAIIRP
jgi:zinc protease